MINQIIFLDIDGVLNDHVRTESGYCTIKPRCAKNFNHIMRKVQAKIVISSAWRYMILHQSMNLVGFENLLLSHGLQIKNRLIGHTCSDEVWPDRGAQIKEWLNANTDWTCRPKYLVLDDEPKIFPSIEKFRHPLHKVNGRSGLTYEDVKKIIRYFNQK